MKRRASARRWLGDLCGKFYAEIYNLTPLQRRAVLRALDKVEQTNCSWTLYRMRPVLRDFVDAASSSREFSRRGKKVRS